MKKLGISEGDNVGLLREPPGFRAALVDVPAGVVFRNSARGRLDVALSFHTRQADLASRLPSLSRAVAPDGAVWVAWPKKASGVSTDITEDTVRELGLPMGLVDNKVCAIDDTWSGLRMVWRTSLRRPGMR